MTMDIGTSKLLAKMNAFKLALASEAIVAVDNTCQTIVTYAKLTHGMQGGVASGAGKQVFENQTYDLETSIHSDVPKTNGTMIEGNVRATVDHAVAIEFGSSTNRPYPFLTPSVEANAKVLSIELGLALVRASR